MTRLRLQLLAIVALVGVGLCSQRSSSGFAATNGATKHRPISAKTLLVKLRTGGAADLRWLDGLGSVAAMRVLPAIDTVIVRVTRGSIEGARVSLVADKHVQSVDTDVPIRSDIVPDDPLYPRQWALEMMQAPFAWEIATGSASVVVAVLDSGVDLTHPDLAAHILPIGCNLVADGSCTSDGHGTPPQDLDGHGSQVAGVITALTDNHAGVAGVAWNAPILPVKVTSNQGAGSSPVGTESDFITGLIWAVDHGANVLNFSFSEDCGAQESAPMRDALAYGWNHGALLVASAGNDGGCPAGVFPAADPHVLAVSATDINDRPLQGSSGSNFGPWVRAAAPGQHIQTAYTNGQYSFFDGTSAAAPQVAGLAALLFSLPGATNSSVLNWILSTCDVPAGWNPAYGCGRVNAYRAVSLAGRGMDPRGPAPAPVSLHLSYGWNNLLYVGPTRSVDNALSTIRGKYTSVYGWDSLRNVWHVFLPGQPVASDLDVLGERSAYWIFVPADVDLTMNPTGTAPPPQLTLSPGWNNIALPAGALPDALQRFSRPVSGVFAWNPGKSAWTGFFANATAVSDLKSLQPDSAYWVYAPARIVVRFGQ